MPHTDVVAFFYAIGSRYSYLASTQLAAIERDCGCRFDWIPLNSVELMKRRGRSPFAGEPVSGQYDWSYRETDARRWADLYGVPFHEPRGRVDFDPRLLALAAVAAKRLDRVVPYGHALFHAMFGDPAVTRIDRAECVRRAEACGITAAAFERALDEPGVADALEDGTRRALEAGVFGVPSFVVAGELFWGNDRLVLLRHRLHAAAR